MRILKVDKKRGLLEVLPEDKEDLWLLSLLLSPGDIVEGIVTRRIKREDERGSGKLFTFKVKIDVEEVEFNGSSLRIKGKIQEGPEDLVGRGRYQTLEIREGQKFKIFRDYIDEALLEEIKRAETASNHPPVLVVSLDDDTATVGRYSRRLTYLTTIRRRDVEESLKEFFGEVLKVLREQPEDIIVIGGPKIVLDEFKKFVEERGPAKKIHYVVSPLSGEKGLKDIVHKRAHKIIHSEREAKISEFLEEFLMHLSKNDGLASLRPEEDVETGNIRILLIHEEWIKENRDLAHKLMKMAREVGAQVFIVSKDIDGEAIIRKLGGKIGIKRYAL